MLISILIVFALIQTNAAVSNRFKRDNTINLVNEPVNNLKFFARNFAEVFVKQKPVDFSRLKSLSNLDLSKIIDNVIKLNQAVPNNTNVFVSQNSKIVEVKPVKMVVNSNTTTTTTQVKTPSFTSLKVIENTTVRPRFEEGFRGVFNGFKNALKSKFPSVFKKRPLLDSFFSSLDKLKNTTVKNRVVHEHKVVFIKAKIPILVGKVLSVPDDEFESLVETQPLNETQSISNNNNTNSTNSSEIVTAENNPETKNITLGTLLSALNVTVPQFITSINNLTLPLPISSIFGFIAKKKVAAQQQEEEKTTRFSRPVIILGRSSFPPQARPTRQFNVGFGGDGFGVGGGFPTHSGFGGGGFIGGGFHHRGGSNFNNNNLNGGGFRGGVNFNNNNMNGLGASNFNNNNFNDYDGGGVNFNNNNGR